MTKVIVAAAAVGALVCGAVAAHASPGPLSNRIVVSATDDPAAYDLMYVSATGATLDLARLGVPDANPVVSPNGKLVAFTRAGAEWVVGTSGKSLRRVSPVLTGLATPQVAWTPDSRTLAVIDGSSVYRVSASGGGWTRLARGAASLVGWSPDGTRLAYTTSLAGIDFATSTGRHVALDLNGVTARWSPSGRLAVQRTSTTWDVYSESGKRLAAYAATNAAWSGTGALATIDAGGTVRIRRGGIGRPTVTARPSRSGDDLAWAGPTHLLVGDELLFDLVHRKTFLAPAAYRLGHSLASDGSAFGEPRFGTLVHATLSGSTRTVSTFAGVCGGRDTDPYAGLQTLPDGSGAIYESTCAPAHDLFSIAPDGSGLTRITDTPTDELSPAVSPDGTKLAFGRLPTGVCVGCDETIWLTAADGGAGASLASAGQDDTPSFSPDGQTVVFSRWQPSVSDSAFLAEAPAGGGAVATLKVTGSNPAWGPGRIAYDGPGGVTTILPDGTERTIVAKGDDGVPAWSAAGRLALLEHGTGLAIRFPATGVRIALPGLHAPVQYWPRLAWSPDGSRLAFTAADAQGVVDVWTVNADGTGLARITHGLGADGGLAWR
jgi:Tol biopolymer transport system component